MRAYKQIQTQSGDFVPLTGDSIIEGSVAVRDFPSLTPLLLESLSDSDSNTSSHALVSYGDTTITIQDGRISFKDRVTGIAPVLGSDFTTLDYVEELDDKNVKIEGDQIIDGRKTFPDRMSVVDLAVNSISNYENIDIELSAIPNYTATAFLKTFSDESLINKGYVDDLDDENVKLEGNQSIKGNKTFSDNATVFGDAYLFGDLVWIRNSTAKLQIDSTGNFAPSSGIREPVLLSFQHNGHDIFTVNTEGSLTTLSKFYSDNDDPANATIQMVFDDEGSTTLGDGCVRFTSDVQGKSTGRPTEEKSFVSAKFVDDTFLPLAGGTITGDLTVQGDAYVAGQFNVVSSNDVNIGDRIITLNSEIEDTAAPSLDAGIEIARGTQANAQLLFDESLDQWVAGIVGALKALATEDYVDDGFLSLDGGTVSGDVIIAKANPTFDARASSGNAVFRMRDAANNIAAQLSYRTSLNDVLLQHVSGGNNLVMNASTTTLNTDLQLNGAGTLPNSAVRRDYVDGLDDANVKKTGNQTIVGETTFQNPNGSITANIDAGTFDGTSTLEYLNAGIRSGLVYRTASGTTPDVDLGTLRLRLYDVHDGSVMSELKLGNGRIDSNVAFFAPLNGNGNTVVPRSYIDDNFLSLNGGTLIGGLNIAESAGDSNLNVFSVLGQSPVIQTYIDNKRTSKISGSTSSLSLSKIDSAGAFGATLAISDADISANTQIRAADPSSSTGLVTRQYAENNFLSLDGGTLSDTLNIISSAAELRLRASTGDPQIVYSSSSRNFGRLYADSTFDIFRLAKINASFSVTSELLLRDTYAEFTQRVAAPTTLPSDQGVTLTTKNFVEDYFLGRVDGLATLDGNVTGENELKIKGGTNLGASISLHERRGFSGDNKCQIFAANSMTEDVQIVMPTNMPTVGQILKATTVSGGKAFMAWVDP